MYICIHHTGASSGLGHVLHRALADSVLVTPYGVKGNADTGKHVIVEDVPGLKLGPGHVDRYFVLVDTLREHLDKVDIDPFTVVFNARNFTHACQMLSKELGVNLVPMPAAPTPPAVPEPSKKTKRAQSKPAPPPAEASKKVKYVLCSDSNCADSDACECESV